MLQHTNSAHQHPSTIFGDMSFNHQFLGFEMYVPNIWMIYYDVFYMEDLLVKSTKQKYEFILVILVILWMIYYDVFYMNPWDIRHGHMFP